MRARLPGFRSSRFCIAPLVCFLAAACASPPPSSTDKASRTAEPREEFVDDDATVQAHRAAVEAAQAREQAPQFVDRVELRAGDDYLDGDHQLRAVARLKVRRPGELAAEREVLRAQTDVELARLDEATLDRRVAMCFPSVDWLVRTEENRIYADYDLRQTFLLKWNETWRASGVIDELAGARFELDSRVKLATRKPSPIGGLIRVSIELPGIDPHAKVASGALVRDANHLRTTVNAHHPSAELHRATEEQYRRMIERARTRRLPGLRFVDVSYEHRTESSRNGVGGQVAFEIPLGGESRAEVTRFDALMRQQQHEGRALVEQQVDLSLRALDDVRDFESRSEEWREIARLASDAEQLADRWFNARQSKPAQVAGLLDEAYAARIAILSARERAANARCTLLAMTGVTLDGWPRE